MFHIIKINLDKKIKNRGVWLSPTHEILMQYAIFIQINGRSLENDSMFINVVIANHSETASSHELLRSYK